MQNNQFNRITSFSHWFNRNYMWVICGLIFIFLLIAFFAPILMKLRLEYLARPIYWIYDAFCHQLTFRSWFLFGAQPYYPRILAGIPSLMTYESATSDFQLDLLFARNFIGNDRLGYKVALCQRDIAIYGSLLISGLVFQLTGKKAKPLPWYVWILIGLFPIGIDGITQFGGLGINFLSWLPVRESTPLIRTITGLLFGISTAFFMFPLVEENMRERNKLVLENKAEKR
jgi:uncharacterized membrane protein